MSSSGARRTPVTIAVVAVAAVALVACMITALHALRTTTDNNQRAQSFTVGGCVTVAAANSPAEPGQAQPASCTEDPSYTVGAVVAAGNTCPSPEYQRADSDSNTLCLVPNLVAEHCYLLNMPIGTLARTNCAATPEAGLLVQITKRLDTHDRTACPQTGADHVWPYPSPARTYCTRTLI